MNNEGLEKRLKAAPAKTRTTPRRRPERSPVRRLVTKWAVTGSAARKAVLVALDSYASDEGECWPSVETLCLETELTRRTVQKAIRELEEAGLITATPMSQGGRQRANRYTIDYVACAELVPARQRDASDALRAAFGGAQQVRPRMPGDEGRDNCAPPDDASGAPEGRTPCAPQDDQGAQQVRPGGATGAPGGAQQVRTEQSRGNSPENTHTPPPAPAADDGQPFGVPGLTPTVCEIIVRGTALPNETPETAEEAREQAHSAMARHPDRSKVVSGNVEAARMLAGGEITAAMLEAAVAHYAEVTKGNSRFIHRDNWLKRGCWRDSLAGAATAITERARARAVTADPAVAKTQNMLDAQRAAERAALDEKQARVDEAGRRMAAMEARELAAEAQRIRADLRRREEAGDFMARARLHRLTGRVVTPDDPEWRRAFADAAEAREEVAA